jgi:hypothetical protein
MPPNFPLTPSAALNLTGGNLAPFEVYYGLPGVGALAARKQAFLEAIGFPTA